MTADRPDILLPDLIALSHETEWVELKRSYENPHEIGEYISALANSACLHRKKAGYIVWGIDDDTHKVKGTSFSPRRKKVKGEELENYLARQLDPRIDFTIHEFEFEGKPLVLFLIEPARDIPVRFDGEAYIRVGTNKHNLKGYPEKQRKIWLKRHEEDWSAGICEGASISDLDPAAIRRARQNFRKKNPARAAEIDSWDDPTFLNKIRLTIQGKTTRSAIVLVGKEESEHFLSPSVAKISWILKDGSNQELDYQHFGPPFLLNIEKVYSKIRNLTYRYLVDNTLFPTEVTTYEPYVIREALNNCIAHQDYLLRGRIQIVEMPDHLVFTNVGSFLPGSVEQVIQQDAPQEIYRNRFLADAMVNLNLIDTQGGGIRRMFNYQMQRYFPLPDYDLSEPERVKVRIHGKVLDEKYTRLLMERANLDIWTVILLDRVQKRELISHQDAVRLKADDLLEGRYPNVFLSSKVARITEKKAEYTRARGFDRRYYSDLIEAHLRHHGEATRAEIDELLLDKLPEVLSLEQKKRRIHNLLSEMRIKGTIRNEGPRKSPRWGLVRKSREQRGRQTKKQ